MKSTNVIDMAAWRAAHTPAPAPAVPAVSNVAEEIRMLLMSLTPKAEAKPGS